MERGFNVNAQVLWHFHENFMREEKKQIERNIQTVDICRHFNWIIRYFYTCV